MNLSDWDGHDALLDGVEIDAANQIVSIRLQNYPAAEASAREALVIVFSGVTSVNMSMDLANLASNAFAGHVNHVKIVDGPGTSHFYLVEGYLGVTSLGASLTRPGKAPAAS